MIPIYQNANHIYSYFQPNVKVLEIQEKRKKRFRNMPLEKESQVSQPKLFKDLTGGENKENICLPSLTLANVNEHSTFSMFNKFLKPHKVELSQRTP